MTELHQPGGNADTTADHGHETVAQRGREQPDGRLVQRRPTVQAARSGVRDPRLRQQLATDDRVDPVGTDEHIGAQVTTIGEPHRHHVGVRIETGDGVPEPEKP